MAIAGTNLPDMQTINAVVTQSAKGTGTLGRLVRTRMGMPAINDMMVNTFNLPERSAHRPIQFMLKIVQIPPQK
jgi:hypothetical protein